MPRPCYCDRCEVGGAYDVSQCRKCWLWHNEERYRLSWTDAPTEVVCRYLGRPLDTDEKADRDLNQLADFHFCNALPPLAIVQPLGEAACSCQGCGPKCPAYAPSRLTFLP